MTARLRSAEATRACQSLGVALLLAAGACGRADPPTAPAADVGRLDAKAPASGSEMSQRPTGPMQLPFCTRVVCKPRRIDWSYTLGSYEGPDIMQPDLFVVPTDFTRSVAVFADGGMFKDLREMTLVVKVQGSCVSPTGQVVPGDWEAYPQASIQVGHALATGSPPLFPDGPRTYVLFQAGGLLTLPCYSPLGNVVTGGKIRPKSLRAILSYRTDGGSMYPAVNTSESLLFMSI